MRQKGRMFPGSTFVGPARPKKGLMGRPISPIHFFYSSTVW